MTVSELVAELLADGLVEELGAPAESRVAKPRHRSGWCRMRDTAVGTTLHVTVPTRAAHVFGTATGRRPSE